MVPSKEEWVRENRQRDIANLSAGGPRLGMQTDVLSNYLEEMGSWRKGNQSWGNNCPLISLILAYCNPKIYIQIIQTLHSVLLNLCVQNELL